MTDEELPNLYSGLPDRRLLRIASNWVAQAITVPAKSGLIGVPQTLLEELIRRLGGARLMARLLDPDEVPGDLVYLIETLLDLVASKDQNVQIVKWYHDMPIWLIKESDRVTQIELQLSAGRLSINCTERAP